MAEMFKLSDIKAGYLLRVKDFTKGTEFNMTVVPCDGCPDDPMLWLLNLLSDGALEHCGERGMLACCNPETDFWLLAEFNDDLVTKHGDIRVQAVYGYTSPKFLLSNSTEYRDLLWEREAVEAEAPAPVNGERVPMTLEEIEAALGYPVKII